MDSFVASFQHPVLMLGLIAEELVGESRIGEVEAVFNSTFYIRFDGRIAGDRQNDKQFICMGHAAVEPGPLNCITAAPASNDWRASGLTRGMKAEITADAIRVGGKLTFPLTAPSKAVSTRHRPVWTTCQDRNTLSRGVAAFRQAARRRSDIGGLGLFLDPAFQPQPQHHCCLAAHGPLDDARRWLVAEFQSPEYVSMKNTAWIAKLSGLGPGLTPSGDDFLGGMMIALNYLGERRLNNVLWHETRRQVRNNSNAISLAHLSAAARGLQSAALDHALVAISTGSSNEIEQTMGSIAKIGHSSGWDIMTGIVTTFEGWLQSPAPDQQHTGIH